MSSKSTKSAARSQTGKKGAHQDTSLSNGVLPTPIDVMTLAEAADFLRATEDAIEKMAAAGKLPARRVGDDWRFLRSALCSWLSECGASAPVKEPLSSKQRMLA